MKKSKDNSKVYAEGLSKPSPPTLRIDSSNYKGIENMKIDDVKTLKIKGKVKSVSRDEWNDGKMSCSIEIDSIEDCE